MNQFNQFNQMGLRINTQYNNPYMLNNHKVKEFELLKTKVIGYLSNIDPYIKAKICSNLDLNIVSYQMHLENRDDFKSFLTAFLDMLYNNNLKGNELKIALVLYEAFINKFMHIMNYGVFTPSSINKSIFTNVSRLIVNGICTLDNDKLTIDRMKYLIDICKEFNYNYSSEILSDSHALFALTKGNKNYLWIQEFINRLDVYLPHIIETNHDRLLIFIASVINIVTSKNVLLNSIKEFESRRERFKDFYLVKVTVEYGRNSGHQEVYHSIDLDRFFGINQLMPPSEKDLLPFDNNLANNENKDKPKINKLLTNEQEILFNNMVNEALSNATAGMKEAKPEPVIPMDKLKEQGRKLARELKEQIINNQITNSGCVTYSKNMITEDLEIKNYNVTDIITKSKHFGKYKRDFIFNTKNIIHETLFTNFLSLFTSYLNNGFDPKRTVSEVSTDVIVIDNDIRLILLLKTNLEGKDELVETMYADIEIDKNKKLKDDFNINFIKKVFKLSLLTLIKFNSLIMDKSAGLDIGNFRLDLLKMVMLQIDNFVRHCYGYNTNVGKIKYTNLNYDFTRRVLDSDEYKKLIEVVEQYKLFK